MLLFLIYLKIIKFLNGHIYLATLDKALSSVFIKEERDVQKPIYFISQTLQGAKARYQKLEKLTLALVLVARKLKPYFQSHQMVI